MEATTLNYQLSLCSSSLLDSQSIFYIAIPINASWASRKIPHFKLPDPEMMANVPFLNVC
jgi:hypothetical protein